MRWLKPVLKDVKYVGLGEATHGTKEFFQMKHRILEFLVKEMGFTVFGMEASYQGCENINNYVLHGKGDAYSALTSQEFYVWDVEEVIDMIEWMRQYNLSATGNKKIRFFGFDIQIFARSGAIDSIRNYLKKIDPVLAEQKDSLLRLFYKLDYDRSLYTNERVLLSKKVTLDSLKNEFSDLLFSITLRKGDYIQRSSEKQYNEIYYHIVNILQFTDAYGAFGVRNNINDFNNARDYYMASNFKSFTQQHPDKKIVIWAHNSHITKSTSPAKRFGSHLKSAYEKQYYAMGFTFNKGGFQAIEIKNDGQLGQLEEFIVPESRKGFLGWYFDQTGKGNFIVNFRQDNLPQFINQFIETRLRHWSFGGAANRRNYTNWFGRIKIKDEFDAIIFIDNTTRATPTKTGIR